MGTDRDAGSRGSDGLSLPDLLDIAYVLRLEREDDRDAFDSLLASEPAPVKDVDPDTAEEMRVLGLSA